MHMIHNIYIKSGTIVWQNNRIFSYALAEFSIQQSWPPPPSLGLHYAPTCIKELQHFWVKAFAKRFLCDIWEVKLARIKSHWSKSSLIMFTMLNEGVEKWNQRIFIEKSVEVTQHEISSFGPMEALLVICTVILLWRVDSSYRVYLVAWLWVEYLRQKK